MLTSTTKLYCCWTKKLLKAAEPLIPNLQYLTITESIISTTIWCSPVYQRKVIAQMYPSRLGWLLLLLEAGGFLSSCISCCLDNRKLVGEYCADFWVLFQFCMGFGIIEPSKVSQNSFAYSYANFINSARWVLIRKRALLLDLS